MARGKTITRAATAAWSIVIGLLLVIACATPNSAPDTRIDLSTVAPCPVEDGPGDVVPCVWDAETRGNAAYAYPGARWFLYAADDRCPVDTVQSAETVHCVTRSDWSGQ
jgi:hypothetical protein